MEPRKVKVRKQNGEIEYVEPKDLAPGRILTPNLDEDLLERINWVYRYLKDVLNKEMKNMQTEEQFQLLFMRDDQPQEDINVWEDIVRAWKVAQLSYGDDEETQQLVFRTLMFFVSDYLTEEDKERDDIKNIIHIFVSLRNMDKAVKESVDLDDETEE